MQLTYSLIRCFTYIHGKGHVPVRSESPSEEPPCEGALPRNRLRAQVLEISWTTTIPMKDGMTEDHCATHKDACGDGLEDLLSAARLRFLLDPVLLDLYRLRPIMYNVMLFEAMDVIPIETYELR